MRLARRSTTEHDRLPQNSRTSSVTQRVANPWVDDEPGGGHILYSRIANRECLEAPNSQVVLKPQDLVVLLKLLVLGDQRRSFAELSAELSMSASEVHGSVGRAREARLLHLATGELQVAKASLKEFLLHGAKYAFPATVGAPTRGVPTAYAAPPLHDQIVQPDTELPPVWPTADGERRGIAFYPLYPSVPHAARKDPSLYETLALFDALRGGAARERNLAARLLEERFA